MAEKVCIHCGDMKDSSAFRVGRNQCRQCRNAVDRAYYSSDPGRYRAIAKASRERNFKTSRATISRRGKARRSTLLGWARHIVYHLRRRAKVKGLECSVTPEDIVQATASDLTCPVLHIPLSFGSYKGDPAGPSVDRFHPWLGYTPDNIRVISYLANRLKSDATLPQLKAIVLYMEGGDERNS